MHSRRAIAVACEGVTTVRHVTVDKRFVMCLLTCLASAGQSLDGEHALSHCVGQSLVASVNTIRCCGNFREDHMLCAAIKKSHTRLALG